MPAVDGGGGARAVHVPRVRRRRLLAVLLLPGKCFFDIPKYNISLVSVLQFVVYYNMIVEHSEKCTDCTSL